MKPYNLNAEQANLISGLSVLSKTERAKLLQDWEKEHGATGVRALFVEFFDVVKSLQENMRESVEFFLVTESDMHPHDAEKMNLPTLLGAMKGVEIAMEPCVGMCHGCAFRLGSYANQSLPTAIDASDCVDDGDRFLCHATGTMVDGKPTKMCVGFAHARKAAVCVTT